MGSQLLRLFHNARPPACTPQPWLTMPFPPLRACLHTQEKLGALRRQHEEMERALRQQKEEMEGRLRAEKEELERRLKEQVGSQLGVLAFGLCFTPHAPHMLKSPCGGPWQDACELV